MPSVKKIDEYQYDTSFMDALYSEEHNNSAAAAAPLPTPMVKEKLEVETPKRKDVNRTTISIADFWKRQNGGVAAQSQSLATSENIRDPRKRVGEESIYWGVQIQTKPKAAAPCGESDRTALCEQQLKMEMMIQPKSEAARSYADGSIPSYKVRKIQESQPMSEPTLGPETFDEFLRVTEESDEEMSIPLENRFNSIDELIRVLSDDTDYLEETQEQPDAVGNGARQ
ncbi:uncharacterized protein DMAD_00213 [Drosophila madeirensis]|uniref:Uncharacterized protein n=1 Tax=Drosophila madeirensis TaxID=30013 RepID=A0AAU9FX37_DROMD